jgi:hypothetical protein
MEHDVVLTRRDGSVRYFLIHGRLIPEVGDIITLPIDGRLTKARIGEIHTVPSSRAERLRSVDDVDADEVEGS